MRLDYVIHSIAPSVREREVTIDGEKMTARQETIVMELLPVGGGPTLTFDVPAAKFDTEATVGDTITVTVGKAAK